MAAINKLQRFFAFSALGGIVYLISYFVTPSNNYFIQNSTFSISGKCTLKDWEIISGSARGEGEINIMNGKIQAVSSFTITIPSSSFESGSYTMNNHAEKALKSKKNPTIIFNLKKIERLQLQDDKTQMKVSGDLTAAGITKSISINVNGSSSGGGFVFQGRQPMKMSDFNIEPPTFMLGGIKAEDDVMISFKVFIKSTREVL